MQMSTFASKLNNFKLQKKNENTRKSQFKDLFC